MSNELRIDSNRLVTAILSPDTYVASETPTLGVGRRVSFEAILDPIRSPAVGWAAKAENAATGWIERRSTGETRSFCQSAPLAGKVHPTIGHASLLTLSMTTPVVGTRVIRSFDRALERSVDGDIVALDPGNAVRAIAKLGPRTRKAERRCHEIGDGLILDGPYRPGPLRGHFAYWWRHARPPTRWGQRISAEPTNLLAGPRPAADPVGRRHRRWTSRHLHQIGLVASHAWAGWVVLAVALAWVGWGALSGFPSYWLIILESTTSIVTIVMLFTIQHLHARDQTVIHRKLDEILRSSPKADKKVISIEDAPDEHLQALTEQNRHDRLA
jgi:low affinity Fe/Cu permease